MTDDSLTARNRINQRNFRARRQNYIKELEEKLRKYESEGIQATIEIQSAARQVTDQNTKLRNLLTQRFGMTEFEIANYLGYQQPSPQLYNSPFSNVFTSGTQLASLAATPSGGLAPKPTPLSESAHSYPTPPQSDITRALTSAQLDPALSLANLHRYPSSTNDQQAYSEISSSRHNSEHSIHHNITSKTSTLEGRPPNSPTDTLSESSNPTTPAEQMQIDQIRQASTISQPTSAPCCNPPPESSSTPKAPRPNDETSCEEAARIIASMRGGDGTPDQVMLELGCSNPETRCQVKNLSIFQLMDRG